jgi:hypothetical protein
MYLFALCRLCRFGFLHTCPCHVSFRTLLSLSL